MLRAVDIIRKKRDGKALTSEEIRFFVDGVVEGTVPDYQIAAWLMAVFFQGMDFEETTHLTRWMMESGEVLRFDLPGPVVDKHSTGGVGDKISLPLAPLLASLGMHVPMISGRALGHTGGTLDKLESIPGYNTRLNSEAMARVLREVGATIVGQTEKLVPADRKLYALRDVTATVESIPLIASSIMSKKLAEGLDALILDVKTGSGAFMQEVAQARALARTMVAIGQGMGVRVRALLTDMDRPLGVMVGNALEVVESVDVLRGGGPEDVRELVVELAAHLYEMVGFGDLNEGRARAREHLDSGKAYEKWGAMVRAQGGDPDAISREDFLAVRHVAVMESPADGYVVGMDTRKVGLAATVLGAGRAKAEDTVDPKVGLRVFRKTGDRVRRGEPVVEIRANDESRLEEARKLLREAYRFGETPPPPRALVLEVIETGGPA